MIQRMLLEYTSNGIAYTWDIVSINGAAFILYPGNDHTRGDIMNAKAELRDSRDVVSIRVADEDDQDELYKSQVFSVPATRPLRWYQIEQDKETIRRERKKGTTPEEFVNRIVLPNIEATERKHFTRYGDKIYQS